MSEYNEYKSSYMPIDGDVARQAREGASGDPDSGYEISGSYVNWNTDGGVNNKGWTELINAPNSPFVGMDEEAILGAIANSVGGNLNEYFSKLASLTDRQQKDFIDHLYKYYGFADEGGCIGERLY